MRPGLSVGSWSARAAMRKREAIQPRKIERVEAETLPLVVGSKNQSTSEIEEIPPGSKSVASAQRNTRVPGRSDRLRQKPVEEIEVLQTERTRRTARSRITA